MRCIAASRTNRTRSHDLVSRRIEVLSSGGRRQDIACRRRLPGTRVGRLQRVIVRRQMRHVENDRLRPRLISQVASTAGDASERAAIVRTQAEELASFDEQLRQLVEGFAAPQQDDTYT